VNTQVSDGSTAYAYGPSGLGFPLKSGEYFTQRWATIINNGIPKIAPVKNEEVISTNITGYGISNFEPNSNYKNITLGFDSSGNLLFGVQLQETIKIWYQSGSLSNEYSWNGTYPTLFNNVQVNLPLQFPPLLYPRWNTGEVYCFYQNENNLNYRILSDNFSVEYTGNTNLDFFSGSTQISTIEQPDIDSEDPYRFVRIQSSQDGEKVKTLISQSYTPWALISFEKNSIGPINSFGITGKLTYDYGNWIRNGLIARSSGYVLNFNNFLLDTYESEQVGNAEANLLFNIYRPFLTTGFARQIFNPKGYLQFYESFSGYSPQDDITYFDKSYSLLSGGSQTNIIGRAFIVGSFLSDSFDGYKTGSIKYLRRGIYKGSNSFYGNIFRLY
jgi:hypothetical protein